VPDRFHCSLVTPQASVLDTELTYANLPAHDGQIGVAPSRAPMLIKLGLGKMSLRSDSGEQQYVIDGGFGQMRDNKLTLLCEHAWAPDDVSAEQARQRLAEAEAMPKSTVDEVEARNHQIALAQHLVDISG
jgi:F-type H+-transporting ATPase subunit epsilon